jgi:CBS domain-containing protein
MKIRDIMSAPPVVVPPIASTQDVARHMDHSGVGCVLVVDDGRLIGIVTDRDLALRVLGRGRPGDTCVDMVMTPRPITVRPDDDTDAAYRAFRRNAFRRLPVVDEVDVVTGMVTIDDLLLQTSRLQQDLLRPVASEILEPQHQTA